MANTALITGSTGGLGSCFVKIHGEKGGDMILVGTSEEKLMAQKKEVERRKAGEHGGRAKDGGYNDIAFLLGYAKINSFLRAFAIWTGRTISQYRGHLKQ